VMGDVSSMARRRPGTFLLGALAAGFVAGRVARTAQTVMSEDSDTGRNGQISTAPGAVLPETPMITPGVATEVPAMPPTGYLDPSATGVGPVGSPTAPGR